MLPLRKIRRVNNETICQGKNIAGRVCYGKAIKGDLLVIGRNIYGGQNMPSTWTWRRFPSATWFLKESARRVVIGSLWWVILCREWRWSMSWSRRLGWAVVWAIEYTVVWASRWCIWGSWSKEATHCALRRSKWWRKQLQSTAASHMPELNDSYPVDRHSCQLLGPTALVCHSRVSHRSIWLMQPRSCKVYWGFLFSHLWCTKDIEKLLNDHGRSGTLSYLCNSPELCSGEIVQAVWRVETGCWPSIRS